MGVSNGWRTLGAARRCPVPEPAPNTYEAPGCQETKISSERFFAFFSACGFQHCWQSTACPDLISHAGAPEWLHQTPIEVRSPCL